MAGRRMTATTAEAPGANREARREAAARAAKIDAEPAPKVHVPNGQVAEFVDLPEEGGTDISPEQVLAMTAQQADGLVVNGQVMVGVLFLRPLDGPLDPANPVSFVIKGVTALEAPGLAEVGVQKLRQALGLPTSR